MFVANPRPTFSSRRFLWCRVVVSALLCAVFTRAAMAQDVSPNAIPVFVGDFEILSSAVSLPADSLPAVTSKTTPPKDAPPSVFETSDSPSVQARRLMDFFTATLLQSMQKAGYNSAHRQSGALGSSGVLLRGVFAEADARNRIRRAILGGGIPSARLLLYVGTFNLARPEQPLYQPVASQPADAGYGPIITLNNYLPLVKFEMSKNPTQEEVRKICAQIVQNLNGLLKANPAAFSQ